VLSVFSFLSVWFILVNKYNKGNKVKKDEVDRTCSTHGDDECLHSFSRETRREGTVLKNQASIGGQ
jgi:hypothetical protein